VADEEAVAAGVAPPAMETDGGEVITLTADVDTAPRMEPDLPPDLRTEQVMAPARVLDRVIVTAADRKERAAVAGVANGG